MNIRYTLLALGLTVGLVQGVPEEISVEQQIKVNATDLDDVLTMSDSFWTYLSQSRQALGWKTFTKGIAYVFTSPQALKDIYAAATKNLRYRNGVKVIGAAAYVEFLAKEDMPFLSPEQKQKLIDIAWQVKPNVPLIEFYQFCQKELHIPIYVWTDNDEAGYTRKMANLNAELIKLGKPEFIPDGVKWAEASTPKKAGLSKDHAQYFKEGYQVIQEKHPEFLETQKVLFIDDKKKNVDNARKAAATENLKLDAFQYTGKKDGDLNALKAKFILAK
jgi:hypothetical protein